MAGRLATVAEAAEHLRLSESALQLMCTRGKFKGAFQPNGTGSEWRIPGESILVYYPGCQATLGSKEKALRVMESR